MPQMRSMWGGGGEEEEGGQEDRVRYGVEVLSGVSDTSSSRTGDILHSRPAGMSRGGGTAGQL